MDKNAIKKYAIWARNELIARIAQKAAKFGVLEKNSAPASADSINGVVMTNVQKKQRQALLTKIDEQGYEQTIEEVAYTWFNRFIALRFMEVNNYLPSRVRVFTDPENNFKPEIMSEAINMDLDGINVDHIYGLKDANMDEELFRYMLVLQCNALNKILPVMFQKLEDYTELLLPDNLLREGSIIEKLVSDIPEEDWQDQVQIIGWLYQYYNNDIFNSIYDGNMSKNIVTRNLLPGATQLFTPDWVVKYMVDNTLGRLWIEGHPNDELKANWKYYLEEAEQEPEVQAQLAEIRKEYAQLEPQDLLCIDPCQGSGHILCYMFDVLMQIYEAYGYTSKEAVKNIVEKNIWGVDIDERASQLAYFSVMMKARQYDRRFFSHIVQPNVFAIEESNSIDKGLLQYFGYGMDILSKNVAKTQIEGLLGQMHDAKEYGSIINVNICDWELLKEFICEYDVSDAGLFNTANLYETQDKLQKLICVAQSLAQKYYIVVTNPPYLGSSRFSSKLTEYINNNYKYEKSDLAVAMLKKMTFSFSRITGFVSAITTVSWMYLKSFEMFRRQLLNNKDFVNIVDFGTELFDGKIGHLPIVSWVNRNSCISPKLLAVDLTEYCYSQRNAKKDNFKNSKNYYYVAQKNFKKITGTPIAYSATDKIVSAFDTSIPLAQVANPCQGLITGDVSRFVRKWFECTSSNLNISASYSDSLKSGKWFPYSNGGPARKWYGNNEDVVNWEFDGFEIQHFTDNKGKQRSRPQNQQFYFREGITWSAIAGGSFALRYFPEGFLFSNAGMAVYSEHEKLMYLIGFLNSNLAKRFLGLFNEGLNCNQGDVAKLPVIYKPNKNLTTYVNNCISISKSNWDSFEISWNFESHPFIWLRKLSDCCAGTYIDTDGNMRGVVPPDCRNVENCFKEWKSICNDRFDELKANEEELNRIFIDIYGLQDELTPEVEEKDVTIHKIFDSKDDVPESMKNSNYVLTKQDVVKSFISYAVGCMFGRYSLDVEGLAYAGGDWNEACGIHEGDKKVAAHDWQYGGKYKTFAVDPDNIIPICDDEYFDDDIAGRFVEFVKTVYGEETLEENLKFIADALGGKGSSREIIRGYFVNSFYADHCKTYQKRPIYWQFDSGKKNGFKCLIYMHRYAKDTIARIRTDYVHEQQARYRTAIEGLEARIATASTSERVKLNKQLAAFQAKAEELRDYEEKIHHYADAMIDIDLDDGVKVNYAKFADVLAKVK